ncbi:transporter substrate-binding domain-containing protein [Streptomyces roseus]|uniref:transporter substrate-binding domain-containing protein n=1 Tax=Streptomyces roseus TaxID=66430 RepID=UPI000A4A2881|nr:transporter substrate-binding domain-containing protein [Streptomyces roseus]
MTRPAATATLRSVRVRGALRAAVSQGIHGLSLRTPGGRWTGLDTDIARAVAAAALGDPEAVDWRPVKADDRLAALEAGRADLTVCNLTWTMGREAARRVLFAGITCYDGEGFLVRADAGFTGPADLAGHRLAVHRGCTTAVNLDAWYGPRGLSVEPVAYDDPAEALAAYADGSCAAYVLDRTALAGARAGLPSPRDHHILPVSISREPMAAAVHETDPYWFRLVRWVLQLLLAAEYETPGAAARRANPHGPAVGLDERWADRVLAAVGTYADVYERNLGAASGLDVPRGLNRLWTAGGLHYPVPLH